MTFFAFKSLRDIEVRAIAMHVDLPVVVGRGIRALGYLRPYSDSGLQAAHRGPIRITPAAINF